MEYRPAAAPPGSTLLNGAESVARDARPGPPGRFHDGEAIAIGMHAEYTEHPQGAAGA